MIALSLGRLAVTIDGNRIAMTGRIDDSVTMAELLARLPAGDLVIDTDGVTFVNSIGMREWMRLIRGIRERNVAIELERVADVLMAQMNLIPEFATTVAIRSFHAQYVCSTCGAETCPVVDAVAHAQELRRLSAPRLPCPECAAPMELGDFPERYLMIFRS